MSNNIKLSFYDIQLLEVDSDLKDELALAFLDNLDMSPYLNRNLTYKVFRGIRLCLKHKVPTSLIESNLNETTLLALAELYRKLYTLKNNNLEQYFKRGDKELLIEEDTFRKLVDLTLSDISFETVDFSLVPITHVKTFVSALYQGVKVDDLVRIASKKDADYLQLLISLRQAGIDIEPFLTGEWMEDQIQAIISGRSRISPVNLIRTHINEHFTSGMIELVIKAIDYGCEDVVTALDEDGYPLFNEYQSYNLVEGARFGLDYMKYADPNLNDYQMATIRVQMFEEKDRELRGALSAQLIN